MAKGSDGGAGRFEKKREREENYKKQLPGEDEDPLPPPVEPIETSSEKVGRNDPCPCGSGKKYKQCCGKA
jgi:preprotein translocase subunit SecA